jgi:spore maturation protein SpmB
LLEIILEAGRSAVELTLFLLLPILVVMMALMRVLEAKGVLAFIARLLTPLLRPIGVPGIGVFAMLQMLLVSYAAPATTLSVMERQGISRRGLAATLAMILALSQANASFPLVAVGLSLPLILFTSLVGGFAAAAATYYWFLRTDDESEEAKVEVEEPEPPAHWVTLLIQGGEQGVRLSLQAIPALLLALVALGILVEMGAIPLLERGLSPLLAILGLPAVAVLPFATKYLAGGTAMLGVVTDLIESGAMTATDLNRLAGMMINPLDLVGLAVLCPPKTRLASVARPAIFGAAVGIAVRAVLHLLFG